MERFVYEPIDLCACFDPIFDPPAEQVAEWERLRREQENPFCTVIKRKIGNTWYLVETDCDGDEVLADKIKRMIFSDSGVNCA